MRKRASRIWGLLLVFALLLAVSSQAFAFGGGGVAPTIHLISEDNLEFQGLAESYTYLGAAIEPTFTLLYNGQELAHERDYSVTYTGNNAAGQTATLTVTGKGDYYGSVSKTFAITAAGPMVALNAPALIYIDGDRYLDYTFTVAEIAQASSFTFTVQVNQAFLEPVPEEPIVHQEQCQIGQWDYNAADGQLTVTVQMSGQGLDVSTVEEVSLVTVRFQLQDWVGNGQVGQELEGKLLGEPEIWLFGENRITYQAQTTVLREKTSTKISKSILIYDLNQNGRFDQGDIDMIIDRYYLYTDNDPEWAEASFCDLDASGRVDAGDLLLFYAMLRNTPYNYLQEARYHGLTKVTLQANNSLEGLTKDDIVITKTSGEVLEPNQILDVTVEGTVATVSLAPQAFEPEYSTQLQPSADETFSVGATVHLAGAFDYPTPITIQANGASFADVAGILTTSSPGTTSSWLNLAPAVRLGRKLDGTGQVGQIGTIRATMIVIDDPAAPTESNPGGKGNNKEDGTPLVTAQDYYDYFVPDAKAYLQTSSYGLTDIEVTLVEANNETGVYRLSGDNTATYPAQRGGNIDTYLLEALDLAKDDLLAAGDTYNVIYVVATENFESISYGPTDVHGGKMRTLGLNNYGALVRIGQDSYSAYKKKAFIHELGHDLGMLDHYVESSDGYLDAYDGQTDRFYALGEWSIMGYINGQAHDFLGYEKWQFGWIRNDQVDIITADGTTAHELTTSAVPGGSKLIAIPGPTAGVTYIVEYKRAAGVEIAPHKEPNKPVFANEGVLIYKIDANNGSMQNPIVTINLFPQELPQLQTESLDNSIKRSVLGPVTGVYRYEDAAAGIVITLDESLTALPQDVTAPVSLTVEKRTPTAAEKSPQLTEASFLDFTTIECRVNYDLRGIRRDYITVEKDGAALTGVVIQALSPRTLRIQIGEGQIKSLADMAGVTISTRAFSFFAASNQATVAAAALADVGPVLTDGAFQSLATISLKADLDLSGYAAGDYLITKANGTVIPAEAYTVAYGNGGKEITISLTDRSHFVTGASTEGVTVATIMQSNYNPGPARRAQLYFGTEANGVKLTPASNPLALTSFSMAVTQVEFVDAANLPHPRLAVGDVLDFSDVAVRITYANGDVVETTLSTDFLAAGSGDTGSLGEGKSALFDFGGQTLSVAFDVVAHPLYHSNRYYGIQMYNTSKQLEYWSYTSSRVSAWSRYAITSSANGAFYFRASTWSGDTNQNLYEIYKGNTVLQARSDNYIGQVSLPADASRDTTSWQLRNLGDGTYAIVNAATGKAFAYLGENDGQPLSVTDFDPADVKSSQRFLLNPFKLVQPNYATLNTVITSASGSLQQTIISVDGTDVRSYELWVTEAIAEIFQTAINAARQVVTLDLAESQAEVAEQVAVLEAAIGVFAMSRDNGKIPGVDIMALDAAIWSAEDFLYRLMVSTDGSDCPASLRWLTEDEYQLLEDAIQAAEAAKATAEDDADVEAALAALNEAVAAARAACRTSQMPVVAVRFAEGDPGEIVYTPGDVYTIYDIVVEIEYSSGERDALFLSADSNSGDGDNQMLGEKEAVFTYGSATENVTITVPYTVVAHALLRDNTYLAIRPRTNSGIRLECGNPLYTWGEYSASELAACSWHLSAADSSYYYIYSHWTNAANYYHLEAKDGEQNISCTYTTNPSSAYFQWRIVNLGNGYYAIVNRALNQALTSDGTAQAPIKLTDFEIGDVPDSQMFTVQSYSY